MTSGRKPGALGFDGAGEARGASADADDVVAVIHAARPICFEATCIARSSIWRSSFLLSLWHIRRSFQVSAPVASQMPSEKA